MWGADWTFRHSGNCSASRGSPKLPEWWNFQFAPNNHYKFFFLHNLPSTVVFKLEYALLYRLFAEITTFPIISSRNVRLLSTTSWRHARGRLTPPDIRRNYPERVNIAENQDEYARKFWDDTGLIKNYRNTVFEELRLRMSLYVYVTKCERST